MKTVFCGILLSFLLFGCGTDQTPAPEPAPGSAQPGQKTTAVPPRAPSGSGAPADLNPKFESFAVVREFGGTDRAALFVVRPSQGNFALKKVGVEGLDFLPGYTALTVDAESVAKIFAHSSNPMPQFERDDLLLKYEGATALYFEGYRGTFCDDHRFKLSLFGQLGSLGFVLSFDQSRAFDESGDCAPHIDIFEQRPWQP